MLTPDEVVRLRELENERSEYMKHPDCDDVSWELACPDNAYRLRELYSRRDNQPRDIRFEVIITSHVWAKDIAEAEKIVHRVLHTEAEKIVHRVLHNERLELSFEHRSDIGQNKMKHSERWGVIFGIILVVVWLITTYIVINM